MSGMVFSYGCLVKVVIGFYLGCVGTVTDASYRGFGITHYKISGRCKTEMGLSHDVDFSVVNGFGYTPLVKATKEDWDKTK